eukprot:34244_1
MNHIHIFNKQKVSPPLCHFHMWKSLFYSLLVGEAGEALVPLPTLLLSMHKPHFAKQRNNAAPSGLFALHSRMHIAEHDSSAFASPFMLITISTHKPKTNRAFDDAIIF